MKSIPAKQLIHKMKEGEAFILDIRTEGECLQCRIPSAKWISLDQLSQKIAEIPKDKIVYVHCRSGNRSRQAIERLEALGFDNLVNVEGGIQEFEKYGGKVLRESKMIPVNQQVHVIAGTLILLGTLLGLGLNTWFLLLPLLVGTGLTVAGLTGFCGMERLLNRMPWNQRRAVA